MDKETAEVLDRYQHVPDEPGRETERNLQTMWAIRNAYLSRPADHPDIPLLYWLFTELGKYIFAAKAERKPLTDVSDYQAGDRAGTGPGSPPPEG